MNIEPSPFIFIKKMITSNIKLFKSPYLRCVYGSQSYSYAMVYHTLLGNPRIFNREGLQFLDFFDKGATLEQVQTMVEGNPEKITEGLVKNYFLVPIELDERAILKQKREEHLLMVGRKQTVEHISLSVSNACNFSCNHCMLLQPHRTNQIFRKTKMNWEIAKKSIDLYVRIMTEQGTNYGRLHFGNGEPLLNWTVIEKVLEYCNGMSGFSFDFAINTNLSLLNKEKAEILKHHKVRIVTSLDGLNEANDTIRVTKNGEGTFSIITDKMTLLEQIGYPIDTLSVLVTSGNFHLVDTDVIEFAYNKGITSLSFDFDLTNLLSIPVEERINKIMRLKLYANNHGIYFGGTWFSPFRSLMSNTMLPKIFASCDAAEGKLLVFDPDGSIKICGYTATQVGHLDHIDKLFSESSRFFELLASRLPGADDYCNECIIEGLCNGQCHITREFIVRNQNKFLFEDMCNFYRTMTDTLICDYLESYEDTSLREQKEYYI